MIKSKWLIKTIIVFTSFSFGLVACAKFNTPTKIPNQINDHSKPNDQQNPINQDDLNDQKNPNYLEKPSDQHNPIDQEKPNDQKDLKSPSDNAIVPIKIPPKENQTGRILKRSNPKGSDWYSENSDQFQISYATDLAPDKRPLLHYPKDYPSNLQRNFNDLFERKIVNNNYQIANMQIPQDTKRVQYNVKNLNFSTDKSGVSFNTWDLAANNPDAYDTQIAKNSNNTVPNDTYRKILKYSASLYFDNEVVDLSKDYTSFTDDTGDLRPIYNTPSGTGWILDYQIPENNQYPTKWFYATNLHVIRALSSKDSYGQYKYDPKTNVITKNVRLRYYPVGSDQYDNALGKSGSTLANVDAGQMVVLKSAKLLYTGMDFLKTKPADFFPNYFEKDLEEYIDFAVFEAEFADQEDAKNATQNYYYEKEKFAFRKSSYLTEPLKKWKDPIFYSAGYPASNNSWPLIATNKNPYENGWNYPNLDNAIKNQGSVFANTRQFSSFSNYEGIIDSFLNLSEPTLKFWGRLLVQSGLAYATRHEAMAGGSSGSLVLNNKNEIISLHFADWLNSDVGISAALKSERFLYSNIPNYYLPEYDLIYGNGLDQKTSYRQALHDAFANQGGIKTYLFDQGA
ncbi:hypothetical protein MCAV_01630 [[Mycoplasma] cavipharyngis]|uniref:MIP family Ig-specific serine endopeptidase n=1 Tax=[Mycoplasma] cavipharyngis TaxID=92757 RepID=UPI003704CEC2